MGKKSAIYTGTGDIGMTSLVGGQRVHKTDQRMEACGTVDELSASIGLLLTEIDDTRISELLTFAQHQLFTIGADLASEAENNPLTLENIRQLEEGIDWIDSELPGLNGFVLPGGCRSGALAHVCRTVCRRAERELFRLNKDIPVNKNTLIFINRLSDLLFVIARHENAAKKNEEILWKNV